MSLSVLILPGIGNSGPSHWQTLWESENPHFKRVEQRDWDHPVCQEWVAQLEQAVAQSGAQTILVAHSLACLVVAHWAASTQLSIAGAMLVAVPDPGGANFPAEAVGFSATPDTVFAFPSLVVASTNDPYGSFDYVQDRVRVWGSQLVNIGEAGHINAQSNLGNWREGFDLLQTLMNDKA